MAIPIDQRATCRSIRRGQWRARAIRRAKRQNQNQNGEKYAAHGENPENRQHRLCITESASIPKHRLHTVCSATDGVRHIYHGPVTRRSWGAVTVQLTVATKRLH